MDSNQTFILTLTRRANKLKQNFSIHSGTLDRLERLADRFDCEEQYKFMQKLVQALEETIPGQYDIHLPFYPKLDSYRNTYGHNLALSVLEFKGFYIRTGTPQEGELTEVYIRYPEFFITNQNNEMHTIKELIVKLEVFPGNDRNPPHIVTIYGTRFRLSPSEVVSQYVHSHLTGISWESELRMNKVTWQPFCIGHGDYAATRSIINTEGGMDTDVDMLKLLFFNIEPLVTYESIETTPYRYIASISINKTSQQVLQHITHNAESYREQFWRLCKNHIATHLPDFNWNIINNSGELVDDDVLEEFCRTIVNAYPIVDHWQVLYGKDDTGEYILLNDTSTFRRSYEGLHPNRYMIFQGEKLETFIESLEDELPETDGQFYINPKIKEYVKLQLEQYTRNYLTQKVRQGAIERLQNSHRD